MRFILGSLCASLMLICSGNATAMNGSEDGNVAVEEETVAYVVDADGKVVPFGTTPGWLYGYMRDTTTGRMVPARTITDAKVAVQQVQQAQKQVQEDSDD